MSRRGKAKTPEGAVLRGVLGVLRLHGVPAWRNNTGVLPDRTGRPVRFGKVGSSDVLGVLPPSGRLLAVECKAPGRERGLTAAQRQFLRDVAGAGGVALVVSDAADLARVLPRLLGGARVERDDDGNQWLITDDEKGR